MIFLIIFTVLIILSALFLSIYGLMMNEIALLISSLSVIAASISGLMAIMVLKSSKDKERPFLMLKPNYNRYGSIQISIQNYGTEIAIIEKCEVNNEIKLLHGVDFFEQIKGVTIPPGDSINFILISLNDYEDKSGEFTTKGLIYYKNIENKTFSNDILFNIEKLGPTSYNDTEEIKMFYELQKIPKEIKEIKNELKKIIKK